VNFFLLCYDRYREIFVISHAELAFIAKASYSGLQSVTIGDVRADLLPRDDELVVVCPGTHPFEIADWIRDLNWWPDWFPIIATCHQGFASGGRDLWANIRPELPASGLITYTGHSLGGALAQVLAAYHAAAAMPRCRVVTFGAPRVATALNWRFGPLVRSAIETVEYRRAGDVVPDAPCRPLFRHPTRGVKIGTAVETIDPAVNHAIDRYAEDLAILGL
jgi:Lipase (class 3)